MTPSTLNLQSLKDQVYGQIKAEIVRGGLVPGARIHEGVLRRRYGISRTPIREALLQLAAEGLVVISPRRGIFVAHRTLDEIEEIYDLLGLLEGFAATRAIRRMGTRELGDLAELTAQLEDARERGDIGRFVDVNVQAHEVFLRASGSPRLGEVCAKLRELLHQYPLRMLALPGWMDRSLAEHRQILDAFRAGRADRIESIVRRHWRFKQARRDILERLTAAAVPLGAISPGNVDAGTDHLPQPRGARDGADRRSTQGGTRRQAVPERYRPGARVRSGTHPHR